MSDGDGEEDEQDPEWNLEMERKDPCDTHHGPDADVFFSGTQTIMDMIMMALPGLFLLGSTLLAWFRPIPGGLVNIILGGFALFFFDAYESIVTVILLFGVPVMIGLLFLLSAQERSIVRDRSAIL